MRAGFFTEVYHPVVNGVVASIDALAAGLRGLGHEVSIFAPSAPGQDADEPPVFRIPSLPLPIASPYRLTVPRMPRAPRESVLGGLQIVHAHSPFVTGWMAARTARRFHVPLVYTYHTRLEEYAHYVPFEPNATRRAAETLTRTYANTADAVIVPTSAMRDRLLELDVEVPIEIVPSGIDLPMFERGRRNAQLRARYGVRDGDRLLVTVSRLAREKNIDLLLRALAMSSARIRLVIAGDGPYADELRVLAHDLGAANRVEFAGALEREALPDLYASADAFVFASVTETQGLVLAEAMAAGAFVIAPDVRQIREVTGTAAQLLRADPQTFATAFELLPDHPDESRIQRSRAAAQPFDAKTVAQKVENLYEQLTRTYVRYTMST